MHLLIVVWYKFVLAFYKMQVGANIDIFVILSDLELWNPVPQWTHITQLLIIILLFATCCIYQDVDCNHVSTMS